MRNTEEINIFLENIWKLTGVHLRLVSHTENNTLSDYMQEAPTVLTSYMYNRFYKLEIPQLLAEHKIIHIRHGLGIENIYIPLKNDSFITYGPFTTDFLSADDIEGRLIGAGLSFTPSLYRFFSKELPILSSEKKDAVLQLIFQFFDIPKANQIITPIFLPGENRVYPKAASLTNLAEHEKMLYRYEQSLAFAKNVEEGDYAKCMELLKSALEYRIVRQYSNDDKMNETIIASRIGCVFYYAAIQGGVSPLEAENIYTKHIRAMLATASTDTVRELNRAMLRAFCDAVKNNKETKYSTVVQKVANYISLLGGEALDIDEISHIFKCPIRLLEQEFRKETGCTLKQYHRKVRLHRAAVLLLESNLPISQIAMQTGFYDQNYFARQFKTHYNCSPSEYRYHSISPK